MLVKNVPVGVRRVLGGRGVVGPVLVGASLHDQGSTCVEEGEFYGFLVGE